MKPLNMSRVRKKTCAVTSLSPPVRFHSAFRASFRSKCSLNPESSKKENCLSCTRTVASAGTD